MLKNKLAYFQGGGGINEPTPGKKKYSVEKAITVQPRFVEPFYRNYDLYDVEGVDGPAKHGPGSGWNHMDDHKSIKEFLKFRRERLKNKYVASDTYIEDTPANYKSRADRMKIRADIFSEIIKTAQEHAHEECKNCGNRISCKCMTTKIKYVDSCSNCKNGDENDGANFDYGHGAYDAMNDGKKMKSITDFKRTSPGAFFATDHKNKKLDENYIDFPIDDQIKSDPITVENEPYGGLVGEGPRFPENDFEGKTPEELDFGRDYSDNSKDAVLEGLEEKYLEPSEVGLFGLPDGVDPEGHDADQTNNDKNPYFSVSDEGRQMYGDKWNI